MKKKSLIIVLLLMVVMMFTGCSVLTKEEISLEEVTKVSVTVGDKLYYDNIKFDPNSNILSNGEDGVYAVNPGNILITVNGTKYLVTVKARDAQMLITANQKLKTNEGSKITAEIRPRMAESKFSYSSTDEEVIKVNNFGYVEAVGTGLARVIVKEEITGLEKEVTFVVSDEEEKQYEDLLKMIIETNNINLDLSSNTGIMEAIINYNNNSIVGVSGYKHFNHFQTTPTFGSGLIYKMDVYYKDGSFIKDCKDLSKLEDIDHFNYYVITNRHIIENKNDIKIYVGPDQNEITAKLIQYDNKIDLALLSFESKYYFPTANFGNSDAIEKGEFIISLGNGTGKDDFRTHTFGIISSPKRYVNTDTDFDGVNDWDSEYIQHDASINECDSGGAIVNMKGQVIGINSTKIIGNKFNNVSFAIPINLVKNIVEILETGKRPERATLGVSIVDVSQYQQNPEYFLSRYPFLVIPDDLKYGFYVIEVFRGGVCEKAKVQKNDIIISFNGVEVRYSHQIRSELGKFLIGSGEKAELKILRDGVLMSIDVVF